MTEAIKVQQSVDDQLKGIFHQLMELYERHAQERQLLLKDREEVNRLIQLLVSQTKEIGQYENGIRKRIQDCIRVSAEQAMEGIEKRVTEKSVQSIEQAFTKINKACKLMEEIVVTYRSEKNRFSWKIFAVAILIGVSFSFGYTVLKSIL